MVLGIKGYQMALLLLPAARRNKAHAKARYWLILAERILRQFVATPALGRGPRFVQYMRDAAAADPGPATAIKLAMLVSGITHAFWNAFCLPLDIISQVVINSIFFLLHSPPTVTQVAYPVGMLVRHKPRFVWLQWALEQLASTMAWPLQLLLAAGSTQQQQQQQQQGTDQAPAACLDTFALVAQKPGRAPDLETPAGRLVLATSMGLMLLIVLYAPLLFAWRLERHLKARFMLTVAMQGAAGSDGGSSTPCRSPTKKAGSGSVNAGVGGSGSRKEGWAVAAASGASSGWSTGAAGPVCSSKPALCSSSSTSGSSGSFIGPPASFPLFPTEKGALARHLGAAAGVCFLLGELFVWACTVSPVVAGLLWPQIPGAQDSELGMLST